MDIQLFLASFVEKPIFWVYFICSQESPSRRIIKNTDIGEKENLGSKQKKGKMLCTSGGINMQ